MAEEYCTVLIGYAGTHGWGSGMRERTESHQSHKHMADGWLAVSTQHVSRENLSQRFASPSLADAMHYIYIPTYIQVSIYSNVDAG